MRKALARLCPEPGRTLDPDLVERTFTAPGPDRLWVADFVRHEALWMRVEVKDLHRRAVAAVR